MAIDKIFNDANVDGIADNIFGAVNNSVSEVKQMQQRKAAENVQLVVEAFKKIETNITEKFDNVTDVIEKRVLTIKDGRDGSSGSDGRNGRDGKPGRDGVNGKQGPPGTPGKDGVDGVDGVSVTDASIDFDGSLVISLSSGQQINVGEVVPPELERQLVELRQGGGSAGSSGDVAGPTSSTDNAIVRFDGTTGKLVQNSVVTIADTTGNMAGVGTLGVGAITTTGALVGAATQSAFNTVSTTLNIGGAATAVNIGAATGTLTVANTTLAAKAITASTTLGVTGDTSLATTPVLYSGDGSVSSGRLLGRYSYRTATPTTAYYYDLNNTNTITSADSLAANKLATLIDSTITNANALTAFGTSYGGKAAGLSFVSGTASDITLASVGSAPLLNADINAVVVGYTSVGPRIAIQNYALNDDTANAISYIGAVHRWYPAGTEVVKISSTGLAVTGTLSATGTLSGGTSGTGYSFSGSAPANSLALDSSGNLGIGTSSPTVKLMVESSIATAYSSTDTLAASPIAFLYNTNAGASVAATLRLDAGTAGGNSAATISAIRTGVSSSALTFGTRNGGGDVAERARIDSSGNLGIGTTSPNSDTRAEFTKTENTAYTTSSGGNLITLKNNSTTAGVYAGIQFIAVGNGADVGTAQINAVQTASGSAALAFGTRNSATTAEKMRLDSSGNLLVGTTGLISGTERFSLSGIASDWTQYTRNTNASPYGLRIAYSAAAPNGTGNEFLYCSDNGPTVRATIRSNGGIANYSANDVNLSDRREKINFANSGSYLDKICAIPVQTFNYIDQNLEEDGGLTLGVVAQDVQAVAPELVMESNWASKGEEPKMRLSIYQTDLQYALMKALQELKAEFDAYKASHP